MPEDRIHAGQSRAEQVRTERRRKPGAVNANGIKLGVDESKLDRKNYHYRFVNDTPGRVQSLVAQDYDPAPEMGAKADGNNLGSVNTAQAGVADGKPFNAVLMRKPIKMHEEDQREKQRPLDEIDAAIRRGDVSKQNNQLNGAGVYTPGVNILEEVKRA